MELGPPKELSLCDADIAKFGEVLATFLQSRQMSRAELERRTGLPSGGLSHILKRKRPLRGEHLRLAAKVLEITPEALAPTEGLIGLLRSSHVDPQTRRLLEENAALHAEVERTKSEATSLQATLARIFRERDEARQESASHVEQRSHQDALIAKLGGDLAKAEARMSTLQAQLAAEQSGRATATVANAQWRARNAQLEARLEEIQRAFEVAVRREQGEGARILVAAFAGLGLGMASVRRGSDE
ncbi:MAG: helix-turn-helix domain-containing protein [Myxococcales bacterium]|nr:helix-turn-helix domain-containing protein [Myxococcales bacterium]